MAIKPLYVEKLKELSCQQTSDCSACEQALAKANEDLTAQQAELTDTQAKLAEVSTALETAVAMLATAKSDLEQANAKIAELEKQLSEQPTECDVLAKYLDPVPRLNGETVYYGLKKGIDCPDFSVIANSSLGDKEITLVTSE
ncbi:hypothetical protein [Lonepinella sp. BR2357]|uniref:hypothetical protein n=1 Tax=Lonepinella sp. BR2357 TaxID=3434549 RepID=UPI003F6DCBBB